jgi:hypothetical protein
MNQEHDENPHCHMHQLSSSIVRCLMVSHQTNPTMGVAGVRAEAIALQLHAEASNLPADVMSTYLMHEAAVNLLLLHTVGLVIACHLQL